MPTLGSSAIHFLSIAGLDSDIHIVNRCNAGCWESAKSRCCTGPARSAAKYSTSFLSLRASYPWHELCFSIPPIAVAWAWGTSTAQVSSSLGCPSVRLPLFLALPGQRLAGSQSTQSFWELWLGARKSTPSSASCPRRRSLNSWILGRFHPMERIVAPPCMDAMQKKLGRQTGTDIFHADSVPVHVLYHRGIKFSKLVSE